MARAQAQFDPEADAADVAEAPRATAAEQTPGPLPDPIAESRCRQLASEIDRELAADLDRRSRRRILFNRLLAQIIEDREDLNEAARELGPGERHLLKEFGFVNQFEIVRLLQKHIRIRDTRERVGDPAVLELARERLRLAETAIGRAATEVELAASGGLDGQLRQLESLKNRLIQERNQGIFDLESLVEQRRWLEEVAPDHIRDRCGLEMLRQRQSPLGRQLGELHQKIIEAQQMLNILPFTLRSASTSTVRDATLLNWATTHCPEAIEGGQDNEQINKATLSRHFEELEQEKLPAMQRDYEQILTQWSEVERVVREPLEHWIQFGDQ